MLWLTEENTLDWLPCLQGRSFETDKVKLSFYKHNVVLTPHPSEYSLSIGFTKTERVSERLITKGGLLGFKDQVFLKQLKTKRWSF